MRRRVQKRNWKRGLRTAKRVRSLVGSAQSARSGTQWIVGSARSAGFGNAGIADSITTPAGLNAVGAIGRQMALKRRRAPRRLPGENATRRQVDGVGSCRHRHRHYLSASRGVPPRGAAKRMTSNARSNVPARRGALPGASVQLPRHRGSPSRAHGFHQGRRLTRIRTTSCTRCTASLITIPVLAYEVGPGRTSK
jgi:hypothetical protein